MFVYACVFLASVGMCACAHFSVSTVRGACAVKLLVLSQPMSTAKRITSHEPFSLEGNWKAAQLVRLHTRVYLCVLLHPFVNVYPWPVCCSTHGCLFYFIISFFFFSVCVFVMSERTFLDREFIFSLYFCFDFQRGVLKVRTWLSGSV